MNTKLLAAVAAMITALLLGFALGTKYTPSTGPEPVHGAGEPASENTDEPEILYWVAPMDPDYRRDGPGKSPMGMDLVPVYAEPEGGAAEEDAIYVSPSVKHNLGVRTNTVEIRPLWRRVNATGYVGFDEDLLSRLHVRTAGWAENVRVETLEHDIINIG